jgi:hypothetical protein
MSQAPGWEDRRRTVLLFLLISALALGLAAIAALLVVISQNPHVAPHELFVYGS